MRFTAVRGQRSRDVAGTRVERRRDHRGGVEGAIQRFKERHRFVAWRDVLRRLQTREDGTLVSLMGLGMINILHIHFIFHVSVSPSVPLSQRFVK